MTYGEQRPFDLGPAERKPITGAALVCLLPGRCPSCGGALASSTTWQPPLFIGCYGGSSGDDDQAVPRLRVVDRNEDDLGEPPGVRMRGELFLMGVILVLVATAVALFRYAP